MKRNASLFASAVILLIGLSSGCGRRDELPATAKATPLRIGGVLSKTGPAGAYGGDADKGAVLALEEARKTLPFPVEYLSMDDKSDKIEAAKVARTLIDGQQVSVILGPAISPSALTVGKLADERGVPAVGTSPTLDEITVTDGRVRKNVFRVCFNDSFQGRVMASFVAKTLGRKTAVIIFDKTLPYSVGLSQNFRRDFEKLGGTIVAEEFYSVTDSDYSSLVAKVAAYRADVLFIPGWDENVGPMLKQANGKWDKFILIGGDGWPTNRLLELAGGKIPEAYALSHFIIDDPTPAVAAFSKSYKARYNEDPTPFSALGYDAMMLILDAAKRAGVRDPASMRNAIEQTANLSLVTGSMSFDQYHNPRKQAVVVRILPNGFQFRERIAPD